PADFGKYHGKLKGAIVLNGRPRTAPATNFAATATRFTDEELARGSAAIDPMKGVLPDLAGPDYAGAEKARSRSLAAWAPRSNVCNGSKEECRCPRSWHSRETTPASTDGFHLCADAS